MTTTNGARSVPREKFIHPGTTARTHMGSERAHDLGNLLPLTQTPLVDRLVMRHRTQIGMNSSKSNSIAQALDDIKVGHMYADSPVSITRMLDEIALTFVEPCNPQDITHDAHATRVTYPRVTCRITHVT